MRISDWSSDVCSSDRPTIVPGEDAVMCVLPFFHSYGMTTELNLGVLNGAKLVLVPRFELPMVLTQLAKETPSLFPGVPRLSMQLNEEERKKVGEGKSVYVRVELGGIRIIKKKK